VPFIATKNGPKYLCSNDYKSFKYYTFPDSPLTYADIPTIKNRKDEDVIDIAAFYANFKDFLYNIADNAIKRIIKDKLEGKL
jgi:hypothetical protein